jgi:YihY family inner membrane protein
VAQGINKIEALAELLERTGGDAQRLEVVRRTQRFKRSWIELAETLARVRSDRAYTRWGFNDFYRYCAEELTLKRPTVDKLILSFSTIQSHAPEVLEWDGVAKVIPSYEAVDYFSRAVGKISPDDGEAEAAWDATEDRRDPGEVAPPRPKRRSDEDAEFLQTVRHAVFDEGQPVAELRKRFDPVLYPRPKGAEKLEILQKASAACAPPRRALARHRRHRAQADPAPRGRARRPARRDRRPRRRRAQRPRAPREEEAAPPQGRGAGLRRIIAAEMADQPQPEGEEAPSPPPSPPRRSISARARAVFAAVRDYLSPTEPQPHAAGARRIWLIIAYTFRRWLIEDRATALAASLSLQTLLSVVPVAGLLLTGIGLLGEGRSQAVFEDISRLLIPDPERAHRITEAILGLAHNISVERLGVWGFLSALVVASLVFTTLEKTVNRIWRVTRQRSTVSRFTMFYTLATLGPLIVFYSLAQPVFAAIDRMSLAFTPILTTSVGLILLNRFMPATSVRWRPALIGGLGSAVLFEIGKRGFAAYISVIANYESVYGSLALLPVFMIWTYCSWLLILLGVELAHVAQHINVVAHDGYVHASARSGAGAGDSTVGDAGGRCAGQGAPARGATRARFQHRGARLQAACGGDRDRERIFADAAGPLSAGRRPHRATRGSGAPTGRRPWACVFERGGDGLRRGEARARELVHGDALAWR